MKPKRSRDFDRGSLHFYQNLIRFDEVVMWNLQPSNMCTVQKTSHASVHTQSHSVFAGQWHEFIELLLFILAAAHDVWLLIAQTANIKTIKLWIYGQKLWKEMPVIFGLNFISAFFFFFFFVFSFGVSLSVVTLPTR